MVFASQIFLFAFLPAVLLLYYASGRRLGSAVLLVASYLFYTWGAPRFVLILFAATCFDFMIARLIARGTAHRSRTGWLIVSVAVNLSLLAYYKYAGFFSGAVHDVLGELWVPPQWQPLQIALPIGISFFTFHKLSYVIDVYRGTVPPMKRFALFALYVAFFPQLVAGPIVRYNQIADQLRLRSHTLAKFFDSVVRFCFGLGKKVLIANVLGAAADSIFALPPSEVSFGAGWLAVLCYSFQIYFDFSGYSDMAVGLGKMFGFTLPENFNQPYVSRSITDFWRRWHMSLSNWFKDYLYIPLGGNRISPGRTYLNLWIVFLLCGMWHGANWTFIIWGCYHGLLLVIERLFLLRRLERLPAWLTIPFTFLLVMIGWVFFRSGSVGQAFALLSVILSPLAAGGQPAAAFLNREVAAILIAAAAHSFHAALRPSLPRLAQVILMPAGGSIWARGLASITFFILSWASLAAGSFNPFIYYRF
jgi:alginate O-acetyltransferase complex protein AlgI